MSQTPQIPPPEPAGRRGPATRLRLLLLALLAGAHLVLSALTPIPGYLSVDEATYHMMVKNFAERGDLEIWNGYREFPSPELASASIVAHGGRLVGRPPYLHPVLGAPFYLLSGYRGLFALNAVAFALAVGLTYLIARRLFADLDLALDACLVLALASFAWEYSQAAWTHATALLFNLAAFYAALRALDAEGAAARTGFALLAGVVGGLGVGIRLDSLFVLACLPLPFLFRRPWLPGPVLAIATGALPGLAILSATNLAKFGSLLPLSMGVAGSDQLSELRRYLPFAAAVIVAGAGAWLVARLDLWRRWRARRRHVALAAGLLVAVLVLLPATRRILWRQVTGTYTIVVDLRIKPLAEQERAMTRTPGRAVVYIGGVKKALLQSCPYLPLLLLPALAVARRRREWRQLALLFLVPLAYTGFYSQFAWHGGLALNQRYLVQILPYTSILAVWSLRELTRRLAVPWRRVVPAAAGLTLAVFWIVRLTARSPTLIEFQYLSLPLLLVAGLTLLLLFGLRRARPGLAAPVGALAVAALVWAGLVAFAYDLPLARRARGYNLTTGLRTASLVASDSIFFANALDRFFWLIESDRVRIARPTVDDFRDFPHLVAFHLGAGRRVFAAFHPRGWRILGDGPLAPYETRPLWQAPGFVLAEITLPAEARPGAPPR